MIGLAELRMEAGDAHGALEAAKRGLKFVFDRSKVGPSVTACQKPMFPVMSLRPHMQDFGCTLCLAACTILDAASADCACRLPRSVHAMQLWCSTCWLLKHCLAQDRSQMLGASLCVWLSGLVRVRSPLAQRQWACLQQASGNRPSGEQCVWLAGCQELWG